MAHEVRMKTTGANVLHKDVEFQVWSDGDKLGDLWVSKGGIEWRPAWKSVNTKSMSWTKFAAKMAKE